MVRMNMLIVGTRKSLGGQDGGWGGDVNELGAASRFWMSQGHLVAEYASQVQVSGSELLTETGGGVVPSYTATHVCLRWLSAAVI